MVTKEFLVEKLKEENTYTLSGSGNVQILEDNILFMRRYNLLGGGIKNALDGHYCFVVNIDTFKYVAWKDSDYGSLTWTMPIDNKIFVKVCKANKEKIEQIIAAHILSSYYYDDKKSLIENGYTHHLLCDWRKYPDDLGKLDKMQKLAVDKLKNK